MQRLGIAQRTQAVTLSDLSSLKGAVVMNSWTPGIAVHRIGPVSVPVEPTFLELLHEAYQAEPLESP
ncbi:hypothetical protein DU505_13805 [Billgrantia montanilacus]|uniref:Uncharacterized protein n=1 Tax=Billgrantia montanilacus TaxID=2282305 RepID=A0A368TUN5_9GAMM|nr:hypothetical protein DU505_13805 [Halomonas montanilacus]